MIWQRIVWLTKLIWSMSELAVLLERTGASLNEMAAHLSLVLLAERVELALIAVEVVVVTLSSHVSDNSTRWVVEISGISILVNSLRPVVASLAA